MKKISINSNQKPQQYQRQTDHRNSLPSGSLWNNVEIARNFDFQQNSYVRPFSIIDRNSFDFDTSKINVDRALKYGQNHLNQSISMKSDDCGGGGCLKTNKNHNNNGLSSMQIDGNQILNEQPKLNDKSNINRVITEPINMDMNETDLVKYLAKIPSADPNCPSIAKTIKYDYNDVDNNGRHEQNFSNAQICSCCSFILKTNSKSLPDIDVKFFCICRLCTHSTCI